MLLIPGALFEIGIALWLILEGFDPVAYRDPTGPLPPTPTLTAGEVVDPDDR